MIKLLKSKNAITLIALVITIVVLIILAAVAINMTLGNNGIFNRAKTAKEQYQNAQDYEEEQIAKYSNEVESYASLTRAGTVSHNYSLNEQVVGTWVDGKPVYQLTYVGNTPSNAEGEFIPGQYDSLISLNGSIKHSNGNWMPIEVNLYTHITLNSTNTAFKWWTNDYLNRPCIITITYTKTTDTATN